MLLMIFKNLGKRRFFENCVKYLSFEKIKCFFKMAGPVCIRLYFDLIKYFTPKPLCQSMPNFMLSLLGKWERKFI